MRDNIAPAPRHEPLGRGPFQKLHTQLTHVDEVDWAAFERRAGDYDAATRQRGRRSFMLRALDEQRSLRGFSELLSELCASGAPIEIVSSLTQVVRDEATHVDFCDRVVKALGGWEASVPEPRWVRSDATLPLRRRILKTIVGSLCIGETLSVAMIGGVRQHTSDPVVHDVMTRMLADESLHARFGWWWLEETSMCDADRDFVRDELTQLLPVVEQTVRPPRSALHKPHDHSPFGSMSMREREEAFVETMDTQIVPGFERVGFSIAAQWQDLQERRHGRKSA